MFNTREIIYDDLCKLLTDDKATEKDLYDMLIRIQNYWKDMITREDYDNLK